MRSSKAKGSKITDSSAMEGIIDEVLARSAQQIEKYRAGQEGNCSGFFVGQVMKATQGKANPGQVNEPVQTETGSVDNDLAHDYMEQGRKQCCSNCRKTRRRETNSGRDEKRR